MVFLERPISPNSPQPKLAFSSLDRFSLVPTAGLWAVRSGPAVLARSAGFQVSALDLASADCFVVGYDSLDLTLYFLLVLVCRL
jgi:hypothetical protein